LPAKVFLLRPSPQGWKISDTGNGIIPSKLALTRKKIQALKTKGTEEKPRKGKELGTRSIHAPLCKKGSKTRIPGKGGVPRRGGGGWQKKGRKRKETGEKHQDGKKT